MVRKISKGRFIAWKCMELAGILHGKKRQLFIEELDRRTYDNTANIDYSERILRDAQRIYSENKQMRRKYIKAHLKKWEKTVYRYES